MDALKSAAVGTIGKDGWGEVNGSTTTLITNNGSTRTESLVGFSARNLNKYDEDSPINDDKSIVSLPTTSPRERSVKTCTNVAP